MVHHCALFLNDTALALSASGCGKTGLDSKATLAGDIAVALLILITLFDSLSIGLSLLLATTCLLLLIHLQAASIRVALRPACCLSLTMFWHCVSTKD